MPGLRHIQNDKLVGSLLLHSHHLAPPPKRPSLCPFVNLTFFLCGAKQEAGTEFVMDQQRVRELFRWAKDRALPGVTCLLLPLTLDSSHLWGLSMGY